MSGEPAEGNDFELASINAIDSGELRAAQGGIIGGIQILGRALHRGLTIGLGDGVTIRVQCLAVGTDAEGVRSRGNR